MNPSAAVFAPSELRIPDNASALDLPSGHSDPHCDVTLAAPIDLQPLGCTVIDDHCLQFVLDSEDLFYRDVSLVDDSEVSSAVDLEDPPVDEQSPAVLDVPPISDSSLEEARQVIAAVAARADG